MSRPFLWPGIFVARTLCWAKANQELGSAWVAGGHDGYDGGTRAQSDPGGQSWAKLGHARDVIAADDYEEGLAAAAEAVQRCDLCGQAVGHGIRMHGPANGVPPASAAKWGKSRGTRSRVLIVTFTAQLRDQGIRQYAEGRRRARRNGSVGPTDDR